MRSGNNQFDAIANLFGVIRLLQLQHSFLTFSIIVISFASGSYATTELRLWMAYVDRGVEAAVRVWEERNPEYHVAISVYFEGQDAQKLMTAIIGGDPPQVVMQDRFTVGEWASRGAFLPLDDFIREAGLGSGSFYPSTWKEVVYQDHVYGLPYNTDARALYYNKPLLRAAGLIDDQGRAVPPADWDELRRYAVALTKRDKAGRMTQLGFAPNYGNSWLYLYAWLNGGEFLSADSKTVTMDDPAIVEALRYMVDLYDAVGGIQQADAFVTATTGEAVDPFLTGQIAMKIDGDWFLNVAAEYRPDLDFGVAPPPPPSGRETTTWSGGFSFIIPATARHTEPAFDLIMFLLSDEGTALRHRVNAQRAAAQGRGYIPRLSAQPAHNAILYEQVITRGSNLPKNLPESWQTFVGLLPAGKQRPVTPVGQYMWDQQIRAIDLAARNHFPANKVLESARLDVQRKLDHVLAEQRGEGLGPVVSAATIAVITIIVLLLLAGAWWIAARRAGNVVRRDEQYASLFFLSPWLAGFIVLTAGPIVASALFSFCRYDMLSPPRWVGLKNYAALLEDPLFWKSLFNTLYILIAVPLGLVVGLGIALLLNAKVHGMPIYRTLFYLPSVVPVVAASVLWLWVLNPTNGLINTTLRLIGFNYMPLWLADPGWGLGSKASIVLMLLWGAGSSMVIWLAGLQGISKQLYEAAEIDGAGALGKFLGVTIPMLTPYIFVNLIVGTIGVMQLFTQALIMTDGGPADSTLFIVLYIFNSGFRYFEMGYASAIAWVLMLLIVAITLVQALTSKRWVYYESN